MSIAELACSYAALALALSDDGISPTAENISTMVKAANINIESFWPALFAKLLEKKTVEDLISNVGAGGGGAAAAPVSGGAAAAPAAVEKKEEKEEAKEESDDDMGFSLFD